MAGLHPNEPSSSSIFAQFQAYRDKAGETLRSYSPYLHYKLTHNMKPLSQFCNVQRIVLPKSANDLKERISNNFVYFNGNYIIVVLVVLILVLLFTNIYLFLAILASAVGFVYLQGLEIDEVDITVFGKRIVLKKRVLYLVLLIVMVPVILLTGPIGTLLEVVGYSLVVIAVHSSLMDGFQSETSFNESVV